MNRNEIAILVPCYNEEKALPETLDELLALFEKGRIIVINDGSSDSTSEVARKHRVKVIDLAANMGIGVAMQTGYRFAAEKGFGFAVQCDGDGQHRAEEIQLLIKRMEETDADMVVGSRFVDKSVKGFKSLFIRRIAIRYLSLLVKALTGIKIYDVTSGFRIVNRRVIQIFAQNYPFDFPEPESLILLKSHGCRIVETPVSMRERRGGISSIGLFSAVYYMVKVTIGLAITRLRGTF